MCTFKHYIVNHAVVEAYATWKAVKFSRLGYSEGDVMEIVHGLWMNRQSWNRYGQLIDYAKMVFKGLQSWCVRHTKREQTWPTII